VVGDVVLGLIAMVGGLLWLDTGGGVLISVFALASVALGATLIVGSIATRARRPRPGGPRRHVP
jgi:hypothetical protein